MNAQTIFRKNRQCSCGVCEFSRGLGGLTGFLGLGVVEIRLSVAWGDLCRAFSLLGPPGACTQGCDMAGPSALDFVLNAVLGLALGWDGEKGSKGRGDAGRVAGPSTAARNETASLRSG